MHSSSSTFKWCVRDIREISSRRRRQRLAPAERWPTLRIIPKSPACPLGSNKVLLDPVVARQARRDRMLRQTVAHGPTWARARLRSGRGGGAGRPPNSGTKSTTGNDGSSDVALAQAYLQAGSSATQKQEGVKLLWGATEKGNVDAEIQLADLYKDGIAVPKSCVQARILLKAAAATDPTAAQSKLDDLQKENCN